MSKTEKKDAEDTSEKKKDEPGGWVETFKTIVFTVIIFLVVRTFVLQTFFITSGSMEDTMLVGDFLVVNRAAVGSRIPGTNVRIPGYSEVKVGDVLVFDPHHDDTLKLVKRLVGMPGDVLEMRDRVLYRNGEAQDEAYLKFDASPDSTDPDMAWQLEHLAAGTDASEYRPTRDNWGPILIPEGKYFLLGDNRNNSLDSRYWGLLDGWRFEGRVSFIYYSYNQGSTRPFSALREIRWGRIGQRVR